MNNNAEAIIKEEYIQVKKEPFPSLGISVGLKEEKNYFKWAITIIAPDDSIYKDGIFELSIDFNELYPEQKPIVKFNTKIYHCKVSDEGHIDIPSLKNWNRDKSMRHVLSDIFSLFYEQFPSKNPVSNLEIEFETDKNKFKQTAKEWVLKYAK